MTGRNAGGVDRYEPPRDVRGDEKHVRSRNITIKTQNVPKMTNVAEVLNIFSAHPP